MSYINSHPEIREITTDFLTKLFLHKPEDSYQFVSEYFQSFEKNSIQNELKPLIICGPSCSGKTTLIERLLRDYPHYFEKNVVYTTRHPNEDE